MAHLGDLTDDGFAVGDPEGVDDLGEDEGHDRHRQPAADRADRPRRHEDGVPRIREGQQLVERDPLDRLLILSPLAAALIGLRLSYIRALVPHVSPPNRQREWNLSFVFVGESSEERRNSSRILLTPLLTGDRVCYDRQRQGQNQEVRRI